MLCTSSSERDVVGYGREIMFDISQYACGGSTFLTIGAGLRGGRVGAGEGVCPEHGRSQGASSRSFGKVVGAGEAKYFL